LHDVWRKQRAKRQGYAEPSHPFQYQGSADINTYKMFTELGYALLREGGNFSFITPSGIYSDKGTGNLRKLFLNKCQWTHLYAFQNERFVFSGIDHRNKMVVFTVTKGGHTTNILTRFRLGPGDSPEAYELESNILNTEYYLPVSATEITKFSPNTKALLEIRTERDLEILEKIYANSVLLGDKSPKGWGIKYATEFHMTSDSKLFPPRAQWEAKGYRPDEYGHWLKGNWQFYEGNSSVLKRPQGLILSANGNSAISVDEVDDVALPLYQGVMMHQFDFSKKGWVSGTGLRAIWRDVEWEHKQVQPQFIISRDHYHADATTISSLKIAFRDIARSTDERTFIGSLLPNFPCGNVLGILGSDRQNFWAILLCINSFTFDWAVRERMAGTHLNLYVIEELPLVLVSKLEKLSSIRLSLARLCFISSNFALNWLRLRNSVSSDNFYLKPWKYFWALTFYERLRLRCILDAVVTELYGLELEDFAWILRDCDYSTQQVCDSNFARTLEPKGFWRVDKEKDPELRHTVLSLVAFHELKKIGLEAFLNLNDGEGWMLPETLRLADYRLGHDDRAMQPQPVASRLGERFLPWQLEGTAEESWEECERHAENLRLLLGEKSLVNNDQLKTENNPDSTKNSSPDSVQLSIFDQPTEEI